MVTPLRYDLHVTLSPGDLVEALNPFEVGLYFGYLCIIRPQHGRSDTNISKPLFIISRLDGGWWAVLFDERVVELSDKVANAIGFRYLSTLAIAEG